MFSKSMGLIRRLAELFLGKINKAYSTWYNIRKLKIIVNNALFLSGGKWFWKSKFITFVPGACSPRGLNPRHISSVITVPEAARADWVRSHAPSIQSHRGTEVVWPDFQPMRVPEEPVCIDLFRQNPVFTSLHLKSPVHVHRLWTLAIVGSAQHALMIISDKLYLERPERTEPSP